MDYTPIIIAVLGSSGLFTLIQFLLSRHDGRQEKMDRIEAKIDTLQKWQQDYEEKALELNVAVTRLQLLWLIKTQAKNHGTILKTAERYFIKLKGNSEAFDEFDKWRKKENVSIIWFEEILAKEFNKKGKSYDKS